MGSLEEDDFGSALSDSELLAAEGGITSSDTIAGHKRPREDDDNGENLNALPKRQALSTSHTTTSPLAVKILRRSFGLDSFRLKQEAAIARLLSGRSAVVVFPTGGGKSLCYQIPALAFDEMDSAQGTRGCSEGGITLVVSPLIALMKDQVDALIRRGVRAAVMDSTKTKQEYLDTIEAMRNGTLKMLYCAPERLNNEGFIHSISHVRGGVRLVAVDEAHCISEWGHAFRPDYLKIARFVKEIQAERVVCLTATATPRVAKDICNAFQIEDSGLFRTTTYRPNLHLLAESACTKKELFPKLYKFLRSHPGPTIIYVTLQKQAEHLALDLTRQGFTKSKAFHAGMKSEDKTKLQEEFMAANDVIMVATIAFGMGIDKSNIRNVIHFDIPRSLEGYSQEIGRAGRDGLASQCLFYLCSEDLRLRESFARGDLPAKNSVRSLLQDIFTLETTGKAIGDFLEFQLYRQSKDFDIRPTTLSTTYAALELRFGLIRAVTPKYGAYSFKDSGRYLTVSAADHSNVASAILRLAKKPAKGTVYKIDVDQAANTASSQRADIVRKLNDWRDQGVIDLDQSNVINVYRILSKLPSSARDIESLLDSLYEEMEAREKQALERIQQVIELITDNACFSRSLAQHFGDQLTYGKLECGHCSWCSTHERLELKTAPKVQFDGKAFDAVLKAVPVRDDARFLARVAFGIPSPRATAMKLSNNQVFGSMEDHDFTDLLRAFEAECEKGVKRPA